MLGKVARDFAFSSGCEQIVTKPTHIDEGVIDLVLTDVPDVVGVRVDLSTSDDSAIFIDVMLEQSIPHLVCRQEVHLKNSVDSELVRRDVKDLNWNGIIRFPYPASSLNESLLRVSKDRVSKRTIVVRTDDKPWFDNQCVLGHRAKQRAFRVSNRIMTQSD